MGTMNTLRYDAPALPAADVKPDLTNERLQQASKVDAAYRAGMSKGYQMAGSRMSSAVAWVSGLATGASIGLIAGRWL